MTYSKKQLLSYLEEKDFHRLKRYASDWKSADLADIIKELDGSLGLLLFRTLPKRKQADVFSYLDPDDQEKLLVAFTNKEVSFILGEMSPDDRTALFEEFPGSITRRLFKLLSPEDLKETKKLLGYPEESVGRMMTSNYVSIYKDMLVKDALDKIRRKGKDSETLNRIYVVDSEKRLLDSIPLRKLILADPDVYVEDLLSFNFVNLYPYDDREKAVKLMQKYDLVAIPVIDYDGTIIGIVTIDDILDVAEEETTEDIQRLGSVTPLKTSYSSISVFNLYKKRVLWLCVLVALSLVTTSILSVYESVLDAAIILAFFIPLLIGSGGNMGSQAATLMIRALAVGDVKINEWFKVIKKELVLGLMIGVTLGLLAGLVGTLRGGVVVGLIIGSSMLIVLLFANIAGASLPFLLSKLKIDPAVASSPLITTLIDVFGLIIYLSIAMVLLTNI